MTSQLSNPTTATSAGTERPNFAQSLDRAARDLVVAAKERVRRRPLQREEAPDGLAAPRLGPFSGKTVAGARLEPSLGERAAIALLAQAHRLEALRPGDVRYPLAAEPGQMADGERRAALVVRQQTQRIGTLDPRKDVDDRQPARRRLDRLALVRAARGDDEAVDPLREQLLDMAALA